MRGMEFFNYGKSEVMDGHAPSEYADKQKQGSLDKAGKIDVDGFMKDIQASGERCIVNIRCNGKVTSETELDKNDVYTIWFNESSKKWMLMPSKIRMGENE